MTMFPLLMVSPDDSSSTNASNVTGCPDGVKWIWAVIGDCAVTHQEITSAYMGIVSILFWMMVSLPQIYKNFRNIDGMEGISFGLLLQWTAGDTANLVGSLLTHQLTMQIILAGYFVITDVVLQSQFIYYRCRVSKRKKEERAHAQKVAPQLILCILGLYALNCLASPLTPEVNYQGGQHMSRSLLSLDFEQSPSNGTPSFWHTPSNVIGYVIGCFSSILYLGSRAAQIFKNWKRKSCEGLSLMMFFLAVIGNLTYGLQILVLPLSAEFLIEKTPWLIGSLLVITEDTTLLFQFWLYSRPAKDEERRKLLEEEQVVDSGSHGSINASHGYSTDYSIETA